MKNFFLSAVAVLLVGSPLFAGKVNDRVVSSALALREIARAPDGGIPQDLLNKCVCVAVIPGMKRAGFIFGASYGKGLVSCRTEGGEGPWSAPSMLLLQGGSFGLQIGGQSVDLILVVMNMSGMRSLLKSKFTLGGDASVAAGPVGRTVAAETDAWMAAEILTYSRSRGLFGGLILKGGALRPDRDANHILYGKEMEPKDLLLHQLDSVPEDAKIFLDEISKISPKKAEN